MDTRDLNQDHMEAVEMGTQLISTMARPDRHIDVDRPGDRLTFEEKAFAHEG
ncbi:MAG TPA: hypothetical protein VNZ58_05510 [Thermomicrobiales bacterium]|nr:hypothetical protein [Thermomicrobiales bacterium]